MLRDNGSSVGQVDYVVRGVVCTPYGFSAPVSQKTINIVISTMELSLTCYQVLHQLGKDSCAKLTKNWFSD